jgi:23S rRNA (uracil1939-C5)-methyltransferase
VKKKLPLIEQVTITDIASQGKALARIDNFVTFVSNAIPGDVVDIQVFRRRKSYQEAYAVHFHSLSDKRTSPFCEHFGTCGGCRWQDLKYSEQLYYKQKEVADILDRIGKASFPSPEPIIGAPLEKFYRNKLEFTFSNRRWLSPEEIGVGGKITEKDGLGFHIRSKFDKIIDLKNCYLQPEPSNSIRQTTRDFAISNSFSFFDMLNHSGLLRNLIVRTSSEGEVLVALIFFENNPDAINKILGHIRDVHPEVTSLMYAINTKANDSIFDLDFILFSGKDHIIEKMDNLKFRIGPKSFFQTNTDQGLALYRLVRDYAGLKGSEIVYDLYTGTGTIAIFLAALAGKIIGIESVGEAVRDADLNSSLNNTINTSFICGDIRDVLNEELFIKEGYPDVIITDPPRAGMHPEVIKSILLASPQKIIYVSCNPATQARDINLLSQQYEITRIQPVDMFPQTCHVENLVLLERKGGIGTGS